VKVQIVYLSPEDDIHSTLDMLGWVKASRALLVWPDHGRVLTRRLDLVLLKRFSLQRHIEIGLLTFDREVRNEASEIGIPVFQSLDVVPEEGWTLDDQSEHPARPSRDTDPEPFLVEPPVERSTGWLERLSPYQRGFLALGILICLTAIIGLLLPSAQIILSPSSVKKEFSFDIDLAEGEFDGSKMDFISTQTIKLRSEGKSTRQSTGLALVPQSNATGKVIFTSLSQDAIEIPVGTVLCSNDVNGIQFRTTRTAMLPDGIGTSVEVPVEALAPGWTGNVPADSISLIQGPLGILAKVSNLEPTSGGQAEIQHRVLQVDLDQLEEALIRDLMEAAEQDWAASQPPDQILIKGSLELLDVLDRQVDHAPGDVAGTISLTLSLEFSALTLSTKDLHDQTMINFPDELSSQDLPIPGTFTFSPQILSAEDGSGRRWIKVIVNVETYQAFDSESMKRVIRGLSPSEAVDLLFEKYPLSTRPEFILKPRWYPILPVVDQRIDFVWRWESGL
jgi:hypothetical protein